MPPDSQVSKDASALPQAAASFASFSEEQKKEFWATLALKHTHGLGQRKACLLLKKFGSAFKAVENPDAWKAAQIGEAVINSFKSEEWREKAGAEWALAKTPNLNILLWSNPYYPALLKEIPEPSLLLYFKGKLELLTGPCVGVVGARRASPDALAASANIGHELSKAGITVISGLARGVDSEAHKAALKGPGSTIAVLGCGLNVYYPRENRALQDKISESGLVITEYPLDTQPEPFQFPVRNRLISGLALGVLVAEAAGRSGSLITARLALEYGREVFAIPGKFAASKAQGSHDLIRRGAKPVLDLDDLLIELVPRLKAYAEFGPQAAALGEMAEQAETARKNAETAAAQTGPGNRSAAEAKKHPEKSGSNSEPATTYPGRTEYSGDLQIQIVRLLETEGPLQADSICALLKIPAAKLSGELLMLELSGKIRRYPGMVYAPA